MAETEISNYSQFDPQNVPGYVPPSTTDGALVSPLTDSTIQKSELEALVALMVAGIPILMPPAINGNSSTSGTSDQIAAMGLKMEQTKHDIISKMWDTYIENIRQIAERAKKEDIKHQTEDATKAGPMSSVEYLNYLVSLPATKRADEAEGNGLVIQFTNTFNQWLVQPVAAGGDNLSVASAGPYPSTSFIAGTIASAIGFDSALIGVNLSTSPLSDAVYAVGPTSGLPGDSQVAAAMVAALMYGGALFKATQETLVPAGGKPQFDVNFAMSFANNIKAIVTKNVDEMDPKDPNSGGKNRMIGLMLSAMALNMLYRAVFGGMEGKEFADLLKPNGLAGKEFDDLDPEVKKLLGDLVGLVNRYLPKDKREETIARLSEYVDSKDSVDSMLATARLFTGSLAENLNTKHLTETTS